MIILLFTTDAKNWIWWNVAVRLSLVRLQLKKFCWSTHKTSMIFWQPPIKIRMKTVWRSSAQTTMPFIFIRYGINHVEYFKFEEKKNWKNRKKNMKFSSILIAVIVRAIQIGRWQYDWIGWQYIAEWCAKWYGHYTTARPSCHESRIQWILFLQ